jgi:uncharacterized membrane protein
MRKWYPALLVLLAFAAGAYAYGKLPPSVPIHWDAHGRVNGYGPRGLAAFLMPCIIAAIWALLTVLPHADPLRANYAKFGGTYAYLVDVVLTFMFVIHVVTLRAAMGAHMDMARIVGVMIGLLFIAIGNVLPRARRNWFMGIRTPWTLSSDRVWDRTHRVGGYLFIAAGVLALITSLVAGAAAIPVSVGLAVAAAFVAAAYSYALWRQERR